MRTINKGGILDSVRPRTTRKVKAELTKIVETATGYLVGSADPDGTIPQARRLDVQERVGDMVQSFFSVGRRVFDQDGVTALTPFGQILNEEYVYVVYKAVEVQHNWLRRNLPGDVFAYLQSAQRPVPMEEMTKAQYHQALARWAHERMIVAGGGNPYALIEQEENPFLRRNDESIEAYRARLDDLRIFRPNPLAEIDPERRWVPMHQWTDERGYQLSDRVWEAGVNTRSKIDKLLADGLNEGTSALDLAKTLEQFLLPDRALLRTNKPYGTNAAYDAMRLARSEIARAANQAAYMASYLNPYVDQIDIARSNNPGPCPSGICQAMASVGPGGGRLRPPYPVAGAPIPIYHPHCKCRVQPVVTDSADAVTKRLQAVMQEADRLLLQPVLNPADIENFVQLLVGNVLSQLVQVVI